MPSTFDQSSSAFLASLDAEIERLQSIRQQIADALGSEMSAQPGRVSAKSTKRKGMSEEGRRKIAAAQKARWAKQKREIKPVAKKAVAKKGASNKAPAKKSAAKKTSAKKAAAVKAVEQS